jgi:hypothetical protein
MAITKERLQELINEGATIYTNRLKKPEKYKLYKDYFIDKDKLCACNKSHTAIDCVIKLDKLFETQKQAEWSLKYQHIPRTEELNLPMWEEIEKIKEKDVYIIAKPKEMRFYIDYKFLIPQIKLCTLEDVFNWNLDEEGYLSACDLCLKLFKGEKE